MCRYVFGLSLVILFFSSLLLTDAVAVDLENSDCIKCHTQAVADIEGHGQKHKAEVSCLDCHLGHLPVSDNTIPECAMCHPMEDNKHYAVNQCVACHAPHAPLDIDFSKVEDVNPVCRSCHDAEGVQLTEYPSLHTELDCMECHTDHKAWQSCLDCHDGHSEGMTYEDCLRCHKPHKPTVVKYDDQVPNNWCSECHQEVVDTLIANQTKHRGLLCVYCHKEQHKMVPSCETCHNQPHTGKLHKKFPDCQECHGGPHDLER